MNMPVSIALPKLKSLAEIFSKLNSGKHINRMSEPTLWAEMEDEHASYAALFAALGYSLSVDARGFAWFQFDEASSAVSKTTRQLALVFMVLFEHQADAGKPLHRFTDWLIDAPMLAALLERQQAVLEAEGLDSAESLAAVFRSAANYGFAQADAAGFRLLPAVFRYLDRFEALAREEGELPEQGAEDEVADESANEAHDDAEDEA